MPRFSYRAKTAAGEIIADTLEAENLKAATAKLQAAGYFPVGIKLYTEKRKFNFFKKKCSHNDLTLFTRRLSDAIQGGLPLVRALGVLERQTEKQEMKEITRSLRVAVQEGQGFSAALRKYPEIFPSLYSGMIQAGESTGLLEVVITRLAEFHEKEDELRHRVFSALAYPVVMLGVGCLSVLFLLAFVIPKFEMMFQDMGQILPLPTRILITASKVMQNGWWLYIPGIFLAVTGLQRFYATDRGKRFFDALQLKLPLFGGLIQKELVSRFIRMLSILLSNGVSILDALLLARNSIGNRILSEEIDRIYKSVKEGKGLVGPVSQSPLFPPLVAEMMAIGDETGSMEASLARVADIYEKEVSYAVKTVTSLLEPAIILIVGLMVAFIAMSMLMPVFQMSTMVK
jgi:type II secretory pathway component PulF